LDTGASDDPDAAANKDCDDQPHKGTTPGVPQSPGPAGTGLSTRCPAHHRYRTLPGAMLREEQDQCYVPQLQIA
jgi:hypothetical protein